MPLQWCNQIWQSLEEGAGKRCSECDLNPASSTSILPRHLYLLLVDVVFLETETALLVVTEVTETDATSPGRALGVVNALAETSAFLRHW